jgi:site-specific DNA recombinase
MTILRCAIYTRKSTEDGLEQDFNSLHAQREACEAYIKSQASEGWQCRPKAYHDGGFSGGSMNRPALRQLLADIDAGKIDIVVVYKVDRLTRSLLDFSRIVELLDGKGASFVSVTQAFNTTTSMGRLTLNVLLSFAQFEREVTTERIRDKVAASKKKGIWMGGLVPLGYDLKDRQLLVNAEEARTVRWLYQAYVKLGNVRLLKEEADKQGVRSKCYTQGNGKTVGGNSFARGQLYCLLKNPLYTGKTRHKDNIYEGQHKAIIDEALWQEVQHLLATNGGTRLVDHNMPSRGWLARRLIDSTGEPMVASHATKAGRKYRYYVSASLMAKKPDNSKGWRLPAYNIEKTVITGIMSLLKDPIKVLTVLGITQITTELISQISRTSKQLIKNIESASLADITPLIRALLQQVRVTLYEVTIDIDVKGLARAVNMGGTLDIEVNGNIPPSAHTITVPVQLKRRGVEMRIVILGREQDNNDQDDILAKLVAQAHVWFEQLKSGASITEIAKAENIHIADVSRILPLAFLAPDIVTDILDGNHPVELTAEKLKRLGSLPLRWNDQRRTLGFAAA